MSIIAETIRGINIVISGETTGLSKALSDIIQQSKSIQSELKQVDKLLRLDPKNTELLAQKQKLLAEAVANSREKLDRLRATQEQVNEQFRKGEINEGQYRAFQREVVKTEQELQRFETRLKETNRVFDNFASSLKSTGKKMSSVGTTLTKTATVPIMAIGGVAFTAANDFDKASNIIRTQAGATGEVLTGLENDFEEVFKNVPADADTVAIAIADLNTRTGATGEQLQILATRAVELAKLTGGDVSTQIAAVTRVFGDWSIASENQVNTMNYLWKVSQSTGIGVDALAQRVVQFGAPLRQMGFDFETGAALIGKWEKEGVNTELVLGSLRIALTRMAREGITDTSAALIEMTAQIKNAGSTGEANTLAMEMFGAKAGPDMAAAIREGRFEIDDLLKSLKESPETILGAAEDTRTFSDHLMILKNNAQAALAPFGEELLNAFTMALPVIKDMANFIGFLVKKFVSLSPITQEIILIIAGLVAAIGPVLFILGPIVSALGSIIGAMGALNAAIMSGAVGIGILTTVFSVLGTVFAVLTGPIGLIIVAFAAFAAIAVVIIKNWEPMGVFFANLWNGIRDVFIVTLNVIESFISTTWASIKTITEIAWNSIKMAIIVPVDAVKNLLSIAWSSITSTATNAWDSMESSAAAIWNNIETTISNPIDNLNNSLSEIWSSITSTAINAWDSMKSSAGGIFSQIKEAIISPFRNIHIPMPHFNLSTLQKTIAGITFPMPKVSVDWYAKGGIFTSPQIIGVGERGPEAIVPLNKASGIGGVTVNMYGPINIRDDQDIYRVSRELFSLQQRATRARGLI